MRTTVARADDLIRTARGVHRGGGKTALIREGLKALIERESARRLASLGGTMPGLRNTPRRRPGRSSSPEIDSRRHVGLDGPPAFRQQRNAPASSAGAGRHPPVHHCGTCAGFSQQSHQDACTARPLAAGTGGATERTAADDRGTPLVQPGHRPDRRTLNRLSTYRCAHASVDER